MSARAPQATRHAVVASAGPLQQRQPPRLTPSSFLTPRSSAARRRRSRHVRAAAGPRYDAFDPDTYAHDLEDDDDYSNGGFGQEAGGGSAHDGPAGSSQPSVGASTSTPGRSYALLLLAVGALSRLLSRLRTAVLATGKVTWQLGGEALLGLRRSAAMAKARASQSFTRSPAAKNVETWQRRLEAVQHELPEDLWGKIMWLWDRPHVQKLRLTVSMANFSIRLPALVALVATQIGLLSTSLSLPMLAPLLLGTGMLLRSIRTNASLVFPRIGLLVVLLWLLWFANSVIQNTVAYLRKQGAIDQRLANNINSGAELAVLLTAAVILLSMLGVNVSALLLPAGVAVAVAAKDLSHNFLAGFFLMMVQPFRLGDRVGVTLLPGSLGSYGGGSSWFEGVCEKVDLRYTSLRQGKRRLVVPNSAFLRQPFMILEDVPIGASAPPAGPPTDADVPAAAAAGYQPFVTHDGRHVWHPVAGAPAQQELVPEAYAGVPGVWAVNGTGGPSLRRSLAQQPDQQQHEHEQQQQHTTADGVGARGPPQSQQAPSTVPQPPPTHPQTFS